MSVDGMQAEFQVVQLSNSIWKIPGYYSELSYLGSGAFGQVCSAHDDRNNITVAIKKIKEPFLTPDHAKRVYREVKLLRNMNHDNVSAILENLNEIYMVSALMDRDLRKLLDRYQLTDTQTKLVVYQILRALKDLKPSNIAINDNFEIKILDFGLSRQVNAKENIDLTPYVVARSYRAPEILFNWMHYQSGVDIWSTGCIFAELLTNQVLFKSDDSIQHMNCIFHLLGTPSTELLNKMTSKDAQLYIRQLPKRKRKDFSEVFRNADSTALDLLGRMFDMDPDTRISACDCLNHPYIKHLSDPSDEPELQPQDMTFENEARDIAGWKKLLFEEVTRF